MGDLIRAAALCTIVAQLGCFGGTTAPPAAVPGQFALPQENPAFFAVADAEMLWEPLADVVDDYFRIAHEEPVRRVGNILTEGRIDTYPVTAATYLEPWRKDSVTSADRLEATLQSLRRRAIVRVMPASGGFLIEVQVFKEVEDVLHPEHSTIGTAEISDALHAGSIDAGESTVEVAVPGRLGWISRGRDFALEQRMLAQLRARLALPPAPIAAPIFAPPITP